MNFIKSIFKSDSNIKEAKPSFPWKILQNENQIATLIEESKNNPVIIFKHSTRCGTSRMVLKLFEKKWADRLDVNFYFLDLLRYRAISSAVSKEFGVVHQSPQLILLKNAKVVAHDSHSGLLRISF